MTDIIKQIKPDHTGADFELHRDAVLLDIVGNTICADLLDYGRRDPYFSGLRCAFDDRVMRYLAPITVEGKLSPTGLPCIRLGVEFYTNKVRLDVISEASKILKTRYSISENVLFHPTKCAAGAMLGSSIQLLGLSKFPEWLQMLTDAQLIDTLRRTAVSLEKLSDQVGSSEDMPSSSKEIAKRLWSPDDQTKELLFQCIDGIFCGSHSESADALATRARAVRRILANLVARRYPFLVYRLSGGVTHGIEQDAASIAKMYSEPSNRFALERDIEDKSALPLGSVFVHCPKRETSMKLTRTIVFGKELNKANYLRNLTEVCGESMSLSPYEAEIRDIENMYKSIWRFHVFLERAYQYKALLVNQVIEEAIGFPNDTLLQDELLEDLDEANPYRLLATAYQTQVATVRRPAVIEELDSCSSQRRLGCDEEEAHELVKMAIRRVEEVHLDETRDSYEERLDL